MYLTLTLYLLVTLLLWAGIFLAALQRWPRDAHRDVDRWEPHVWIMHMGFVAPTVAYLWPLWLPLLLAGSGIYRFHLYLERRKDKQREETELEELR